MLAVSGYLAFSGSMETQGAASAVIQPAARKPAQIREQANVGGFEPTQTVPLSLRRREELYPAPANRHTGKDLFAATDWSPPPPPAATPVAPAPPVAPALPFSYIGKRRADKGWEVFLSKGDSTFIVREGQTFAETYRVESIQPPQMTLTYMPLSQTQTISVGEAR